ncbi:LytR/AlgR family response regulator transcription factor [Sediminitomix flava]|uniref:LytTR family two component transcriptional regulator n=1 Tax=Sediminitomix flava TaxID=379075 RepID=A0A315ZFF0_SEDFL|nr:LytTR family DNA-binding domain-containing protein [Sediminitomix flava]PWJ44231.1 LytTR family two component transcriptional regulator [Sediminitomix flava]
MNVIIIEDEIPAQRYLTDLLQKHRPNWKVIETLQSVEESVEFIKSNEQPIALYFMDIQLTDGLSFEIFDQCEIDAPVVFVTAYDEYALQAFEVNSLNYMLKPLREEALISTIEKFEAQLVQTSPTEDIIQTVMQDYIGQKKSYRKRFLVQNIKHIEVLPSNQIAYFLSENKAVYAYTFDHRRHQLDFSLDKLSTQLDPEDFYRVNRQCITNVNAVKQLEPYFNGKWILHLNPKTEEQIIISKDKIGKFKQWLDL